MRGALTRIISLCSTMRFRPRGRPLHTALVALSFSHALQVSSSNHAIKGGFLRHINYMFKLFTHVSNCLLPTWFPNSSLAPTSINTFHDFRLVAVLPPSVIYPLPTPIHF